MLRRGGLYKKIGETAGYSTTPFSNATIKAARRMVLGTRMTSDIMHGNSAALPVLRTAMRRMSLPHEKLLRMGVRKGVYLAESFPGAVSCLRDPESKPSGRNITVSEAVEFWQSRIARGASDQSLPAIGTE
jgi:hypothetical protein